MKSHNRTMSSVFAICAAAGVLFSFSVECQGAAPSLLFWKKQQPSRHTRQHHAQHSVHNHSQQQAAQPASSAFDPIPRPAESTQDSGFAPVVTVQPGAWPDITDPATRRPRVALMQFEGNEGSEEDAAQAAVESLRNAVDAANESDAAADNAAQKVTDALDLNISSESVVAEDAAVNDQELDAPSQAHKNVGRYKSGAGQNYDPYDANAPSKYSDYESQPYTLGDIFRNDAKIARLQACEEQFCQTMWSCAGGRCLSRSDRIKRDWRRSFEMRSGNCGCSNIPFPFLSGLIIEPMLGYGFFGGCDGSIDCRQTVKDYAGCPAGSANRPNNCSCQQHFQY